MLNLVQHLFFFFFDVSVRPRPETIECLFITSPLEKGG
jgi:hypothetical protein